MFWTFVCKMKALYRSVIEVIYKKIECISSDDKVLLRMYYSVEVKLSFKFSFIDPFFKTIDILSLLKYRHGDMTQSVCVWCCNSLSYCHSHLLCDCHMIAPWHWGSVLENIHNIVQRTYFVILQIADISVVFLVWCSYRKYCSVLILYCIWNTLFIFSISCFHSSNFVVDGDTQSCNSSDYWADCGQQNRGD